MSIEFNSSNDILNIIVHENRATVDISGNFKEKLTQDI